MVALTSELMTRFGRNQKVPHLETTSPQSRAQPFFNISRRDVARNCDVIRPCRRRPSR